MLTCKEIEERYIVQNGIIRTPGMFEGEARYMPRFYEVYMDGCADDDGRILSVVVEPEDKVEFPELRRRKRVRFVITDSGFVTEV